MNPLHPGYRAPFHTEHFLAPWDGPVKTRESKQRGNHFKAARFEDVFVVRLRNDVSKVQPRGFVINVHTFGFVVSTSTKNGGFPLDFLKKLIGRILKRRVVEQKSKCIRMQSLVQSINRSINQSIVYQSINGSINRQFTERPTYIHPGFICRNRLTPFWQA